MSLYEFLSQYGTEGQCEAVLFASSSHKANVHVVMEHGIPAPITDASFESV